MTIICFDCEVFAHDWLVVAKTIGQEGFTSFHNDSESAKEFFSQPDVMFCAFNSKHYDDHIIEAIMRNATPEEVKLVNDWIISGECETQPNPFSLGSRLFRASFDIMDDTQQGLSLKAIEGHLGLDIEETQVDFNITRHLTERELQLTYEYCCNDVEMVERLVELRADYLETKQAVGAMAGLDALSSLRCTNAKLTAALLKATRREHKDERAYVYPKNLKIALIPPEVITFFNRMKDETISDADLFTSKLNIEVGECPVTLGFGGIHGALPCYHEETKADRYIVNYDVASLYPSLMIKYGYTSRNIPEASVFEDVYNRRLAAKAGGDTRTSNALKLVLNTTYGAMLNRYNNLYDPLMGRSVCITGQLLMLQLAVMYVNALPSVKIIQLNTDGIMVSCDSCDLSRIRTELNPAWMKQTDFALEEDCISYIWQKDVNNYVMGIVGKDEPKIKGGWLVRGMSKAGAFNINNNTKAVSQAIIEYLAHGVPVEETINREGRSLLDFQMVAKGSSKFPRVFQYVGNKQIDLQRCNRVYATNNKQYGTLYKVKADTGQVNKIESLPEHCLVDNSNELSVDDIDLGFYVELALKRIDDFLGKRTTEQKGQTRMALEETTQAAPPAKKPTREQKPAPTIDPHKLNTFQKLTLARKMFVESGVKKTGKNMRLEFKYFELEDIVPVASAIFHEIGATHVFSFGKKHCTITFINADCPTDERIEFSIPTFYMAGITNRSGDAVINEIQTLGGTQTYIRRYLYMALLDIVEQDAIDNTNAQEIVKKPAAKVPATLQERKEAVKTVTDTERPASKTQTTQLTKAVKKLLEVDDSVENKKYATDLVRRMKDEVNPMDKAEYEKAIVDIAARLKALKEKADESN